MRDSLTDVGCTRICNVFWVTIGFKRSTFTEAAVACRLPSLAIWPRKPETRESAASDNPKIQSYTPKRRR